MGDETSVWKKEISFRRKPKAEAPAPTPAAPTAPTAAEPVAAQEKPESTSFWKKEIGFRKKQKSEFVALPPEPAVAPPAPVAPPASDAQPPAPHAAVAEPVIPSVPPEAAPLVLPPMTPPPAPPLPAQSAPPVSPASPPASPAPEPYVAAEPPVPVPPAAVPPAHEPHVAAEPPAPVPPAVVPPAPEPHVQAEPVPVSEPAPISEPAVPAAVPAVPPQPEPEPQPEPLQEAPAPESAPVVAAPPAAEAEKSGRLRRKPREKAKSGASAHNQLVGLKIGASQIAAAQVINKGGPRIVRMARMPLQRGIVVGGELREPEELANALKAFFKKNKLPRNSVRLGISNNRIGVRTFEITGIEDPKQLANAVRFRAQETLPIPLEEAVLDHRVLDDRVGEDGVRVCRVLLVVAHKELVERYVGACRKAGLKLVGIDLEAFALLRALSDPDQVPGEDAAVVCVSIGHDRSTLAVSDGRVCEFTRVLAWGGSALDGALARVLDETPSAVVPIKHALSLTGEGEAAGLDAKHADEARRAMVVELQSFARELVASLRFYQEQPKSLGIVEILITGGASTCAGLAEELERLIGIPVRVADPLTRMKARKEPQETADVASASMAVAVGLGIED
jgi:type IV pilus assembly protein PilM